MSITLEQNGKVLLVKGGGTVDTPIPGKYTPDEKANRLVFESDKLSYAITWEEDGDDFINFKREILRGELPKPIKNTAFVEHTENALNLIGGSVIDGKCFESAVVYDSKDGTVIEMKYGDQTVTYTTDVENGIVSNGSMTVDGKTLEISEDGSVTLEQQGDLLIFKGGSVFSELPDRIHFVSDTEFHVTYGKDVWAVTCEDTDDEIKNVKKTKL